MADKSHGYDLVKENGLINDNLVVVNEFIKSGEVTGRRQIEVGDESVPSYAICLLHRSV